MKKTDCIYYNDGDCYLDNKNCDDCIYFEEVIKLG